MIGFELDINGEVISASVEHGIISIIATKVSTNHMDSIDLDFTGLNTGELGNEEYIDWYKSNLKVGDELKIKVIDITKNTAPIEIRKRNRDSTIDQKLKSYHALKKELGEQGLL